MQISACCNYFIPINVTCYINSWMFVRHMRIKMLSNHFVDHNSGVNGGINSTIPSLT